MRQVILYRGEDGFWIAECPSLAGCISQGESRKAAIASVKEAIEAYITALEDDGLPVPEDIFQGLDCSCMNTLPDVSGHDFFRVLVNLGFYSRRLHGSSIKSPTIAYITILKRQMNKAFTKYKIALHQSDEGYSVSVPDLPGCWSQGSTEAEALANIESAIRAYFSVVDDLLHNSEVREN